MRIQDSNVDRGTLSSAQVHETMHGHFRDHAHAAQVLMNLGAIREEKCPHLLAFTPGGLLIAEEMAQRSKIPLNHATLAEFAPPWPGGPIFGAAAFDGTVVIDNELRELCSVTSYELNRLVEEAYNHVARVIEVEDVELEFPNLGGKTAIVVDDGLSSLIAARTAITVARNAGARRVIVALPIGFRRNLQQLDGHADRICCASIR